MVEGAEGSRAREEVDEGGGDCGVVLREGERESRVGRFSSSMDVDGGG